VDISVPDTEFMLVSLLGALLVFWVVWCMFLALLDDQHSARQWFALFTHRVLVPLCIFPLFWRWLTGPAMPADKPKRGERPEPFNLYALPPDVAKMVREITEQTQAQNEAALKRLERYTALSKKQLPLDEDLSNDPYWLPPDGF